MGSVLMKRTPTGGKKIALARQIAIEGKSG